MALAVAFSRALSGVDAPLVRVEVNAGGGLPCTNIVGLPEKEVREARDRVRAALHNAGFDWPAGRITVNLAPADLPKESGRFDLPIAIGILAASGQLPQRLLPQLEFAGELALSGELRAIHGALAMPFRAPHHTASGIALVGGGSPPQPGEVSLAHRGVLFLDELPEFNRHVLEVLREPMESGRITISRAARQADFPARFQLLAAMNPCPCGFAGDPSGKCRCNEVQVARYRRRISGPLLDRIDLHVDVPPLAQADLEQAAPGEGSAAVRGRVERARARQLERQGVANAMLPSGELTRRARMDGDARGLLRHACTRLGLSARSHDRVVKVARTIADLASCGEVTGAH